MKVLLFIDWFIPGYKAGGQIQSCANLTKALQAEIQFYVVTTDRDLGDTEPYAGIITDRWTILDGKINILYLSPQNLTYKNIKSVVKDTQADCLYMNSMFSLHFTIMPLLVCYFNRSIDSRLVLAPRGMLHPGALQFKKRKKQVFLNLFRIMGMHKKLTFHATDAREKEDILQLFGKQAHSELVPDFPVTDQWPIEMTSKQPGELACLFVSRVAPKKNLLFFLELLRQVKGRVRLSIAGPVEEQHYWENCQQVIEQLPENITVNYLGPVPNKELVHVYRKHHVFVLPTWGENFGHVIFESFLYGRPVLISDQTP